MARAFYLILYNLVKLGYNIGKFSLIRLHLGLLYAEKIRVRLGKKLGKALGQAGSESVDVPGYKFHFFVFSFCSLG